MNLLKIFNIPHSNKDRPSSHNLKKEARENLVKRRNFNTQEVYIYSNKFLNEKGFKI